MPKLRLKENSTPASPKLRGTPIDNAKLRELRDAIAKRVDAELEITVEDLGRLQYIQRDSGKIFEVLVIKPKNDIIRLKDGKKTTINLSLKRFLEQIATPGEAWRIAV